MFMRPLLPLLALLPAILLPASAGAAARFTSINGVAVSSGVSTRLAVGQAVGGSLSSARSDDQRLGRTVAVYFDNPTGDDVNNTSITYQCANGRIGALTRIQWQGHIASYALSDLDAISYGSAQSNLTVATRCVISGQALTNSISVDVTPMPYALSATWKTTSSGSQLNLNVATSLFFAGGPSEYAYIVAVYGSSVLVLDNGNWRIYSSGTIPAAGQLANGNLALKSDLGKFDPATPVTIFIGYGSSAAEMLNNVRFQRVN